MNICLAHLFHLLMTVFRFILFSSSSFFSLHDVIMWTFSSFPHFLLIFFISLVLWLFVYIVVQLVSDNLSIVEPVKMDEVLQTHKYRHHILLLWWQFLFIFYYYYSRHIDLCQTSGHFTSSVMRKTLQNFWQLSGHKQQQQNV